MEAAVAPRVKTIKSIDIYMICVFLYAIVQSEISIQYPTVKTIIMTTLFSLSFLAVLMEVLKKVKIKKVAISIWIGMFLIISYLVLKDGWDNGFYLMIPFSFVTHRYNQKEILRRYCLSMFCAIFLIIFLCKIGILQNIVYHNILTGETREYLGFNWTTFGPNMLFGAIMAFIVIKDKNIKAWELLTLFAINYWFNLKTNTTAVYLTVNLALILDLIGKSNTVRSIILKNRVVQKLATHIFSIVCAFTIIFQLFYNSHPNLSIMKEANLALNYRLGLNALAFSNYRITIFGQKIVFNQTGRNYFYLDSSYIYILFTGGIIALVSICWLLNKVSKQAITSENYFLLIALFVLALHSVTDPQLVDIRNNPFIMLIVPSIISLRNTLNVS
ncbi:hypothetical protein [Lactobacillus sp.]|uniref:hypothetical protein n=1 Tax=Lactobacillus sp. TaxID=1591 RepID=UPI003F06E021